MEAIPNSVSGSGAPTAISGDLDLIFPQDH